MLTAQVEKVLRPIRQEIYLARGPKFGVVEDEELVLLPTYLGRRASRVWVEGIPPEIDVAWIAAAVLAETNGKIVVLQATKSKSSNWKVQVLNMIVQGSSEALEEMVETITLDEVVMNVRVEGRIPRCFKCGQKGHIRANCPPSTKMVEGRQPPPQERREEEEETKETPEDKEWETVKRKKNRKRKKVPVERRESVDQVVQGKATEKEAEKGFTMAKKKRRSGGMSSPPEKQKKKREEVRKETVKEGSRKEKESKKKVELSVEKESETQLYEGEMERLVREEEKREPKVQEKGKKIRGGEGVWYYVTYPKNVETEKKIIKLHSIVTVKVPSNVYAEDIKAIVIEKENYRKLKEMCGDNVDPPGVKVEFKELPPVVELREIEPLMKFY
uniref:CCHC-type domain-containing protein n=1 Tax=Octopus bimaculoides TaxID=37653 RepID=A0A0L8G4Z0_OCTBM